jgi:hypothetical protein
MLVSGACVSRPLHAIERASRHLRPCTSSSTSWDAMMTGSSGILRVLFA